MGERSSCGRCGRDRAREGVRLVGKKEQLWQLEEGQSKGIVDFLSFYYRVVDTRKEKLRQLLEGQGKGGSKVGWVRRKN
eukprot:scaffold91678_cov23-Tisochrysis_lutea.AAC.2